MDDFCIQIARLAAWLNPLPKAPLTFAEPGFRQDLETVPQPFVELYLCTEGSLRLDVKQKSEVLGRGDLALANAHFGNVGRQVEGTFRYACVSLEVPDGAAFAAWSRAPLLLVRRAPDLARVESLFKEIAHVHHGPDHPYRDILVKAALLQLLAAAGDTGVRASGSTYNPHVRKAVDIMAERRGDPALALPYLARRTGVSPSHLVRVFKAHLRTSPMRYLTDMRVRQARDLLARSSLSIKEIAFMLGFRDQLYFSRVFRRRLGLSPRAFRRREAR